jgi:hypothetical protein
LLWLFWRGESHELFAWTGLEPQSSWSQPPKVARITNGTWLPPC